MPQERTQASRESRDADAPRLSFVLSSKTRQSLTAGQLALDDGSDQTQGRAPRRSREVGPEIIRVAAPVPCAKALFDVAGLLQGTIAHELPWNML